MATEPGSPSDPFSPGRLGPLTLRNRFIRCAAFEGMSPAGLPSEELIAHHHALAVGGVGMTTVAYCSVSHDGLTFADQLWMHDEILSGLGRLTDGVHAQGAAAALQLGHAGFFANPGATGVRPIGPSRQLCLYTLTRSRAARSEDLERWTAAFASAARRAVSEAGFDAIELHLDHGYLLSQFLSPFTNRRRDDLGGSLANRLRFPLQVVERVSNALPPKAALIAKINLSDGFSGGLVIDEALEVAHALENIGLDGLVLSGGFVSRTPFYMLRGELPVREMVKNEKHKLRRIGLSLFGRLLVPRHPFEEVFFWKDARRVRTAVRLPLVLLGGIRSLAQVRLALEAGFEFVSMGRPLILEPDLVQHWQQGTSQRSGCVPCNKCVAQMEAGGIACVHPDRSALLSGGSNPRRTET